MYSDKRWLHIALTLASVLASTRCPAPLDMQRPSSPALAKVAAVRRLSLSEKERVVLVRAADAALKRDPDPLPVVHVEGTLPALPAYQRALEARRDWDAMAVLSSTYAMVADARYLNGYADYLAAWLDIYRISGNPIDETVLGEWLLAYRSAGAALPTALAQRMREFACDLGIRYTQAQPASRRTSTNNWQSHRAKLSVMGAHVCGNGALISQAEAVFKKQIEQNLLASGETIDFAERDAIHYVVYSVEPLLEASLFARLYGRPLFLITGPEEQSITRTLDWLSPYVRGEKTHQEFVHSHVSFDAERAAAGVAGFVGPFSPKKAQRAYWLAAQLDDKWLELSRKLGLPPITQRAPWLVE